MRLNLSFYKYHGCGNDFIIVDELEKEEIPEIRRARIANMLCKRRHGIGADDVLYLVPSVRQKVDSIVRIFEPDGSEAEMSGNGLRCVAAYLCKKLGKSVVLVDTRSGARHVKKVGKLYRVEMGRPETTRSELGKFLHVAVPDNQQLLNIRLFFQGLGEAEVSIVKVGEPHVIIFVKDVDREDIFKYSVIANNREVFPLGVNVDLVHVIDDSTIQLRTYERGVWNETMACGTGATAAVAVSSIIGAVKSASVKVLTRGGELVVEMSGKSFFLTGPASKVFDGFITFELG